MGNAHPSIAPYELLRPATATSSSRSAPTASSPRSARSLGAPDLAADARFATNADRVANRAALRDELEQRLAARPAPPSGRGADRAGVPAGVVNDIGAAFELAASLGLDPIVRSRATTAPRSV